MAPRTVRAIDSALGGRTNGPLLVSNTGGRLDRHDAARIVARLARRARLAKHITPHRLRHTMVTLALDAGVSLRDVQDAARHADPRTTRRYDRARHALDRHATYTLAAYIAEVMPSSPTYEDQPLGLVAVTADLFAVGAYLGRNLAYQWGWLLFIAAFGCLIGMNVAVQRSQELTVTLLFGFGVLMGLAVAPTLSYYASADPQAVWQAGAAAALFIAGFGAAGYATRRDLSALARILFWALIGLILFGIVAIFVAIPNGALIYAILGLVIFAGLTAFDFQRLRRSQDIRSAPLLAASIFLDILNVFLLLLSLFGGRED